MEKRKEIEEYTKELQSKLKSYQSQSQEQLKNSGSINKINSFSRYSNIHLLNESGIIRTQPTNINSFSSSNILSNNIDITNNNITNTDIISDTITKIQNKTEKKLKKTEKNNNVYADYY